MDGNGHRECLMSDNALIVEVINGTRMKKRKKKRGADMPGYKDYYILITTTKKVLYKAWADTEEEAIKNIKNLPRGAPYKIFVETINYGKKEYEIKKLTLK